ncbi:unnamed protein product [Rotaria magnacalcarata]|uniref:Uncharacterized protein n=3 Tax=Rotaria magnacalcarata TaxID=392030 RepID=A0A816NN82_9BILA|nr:unnamed protein product [Rotaria magnacalcarata]
MSARKKFRRFITDEFVWRSQYELLNGVYCLDHLPSVVKESNDKIQALLDDGCYRFDRINPNLLTYDQTNLIIRNVTDDEILDDRTLEQKFDFNFTQSDVKDRIEIINELLIGQISDPSIYLSQKGEEKLSVRDRKQISPARPSQAKKLPISLSPRRELSDLNRPGTDPTFSDPYGFKRIRAYIDRFYAHYRRSIVFAYRSNNWTLLQNASKSFYDSLEKLTQYLSTTTLNKIFSLNALLSHGYQTMFIASELLLDMLYRTKPFYDNNNDKIINSNTNKLNQWFTNIECSWTGTTFNFEQPQDRNIFIDLRFIRKFILHALHALYVAAKWEKLGTIAIKFNALSDHVFADLTSPLLIAAQTALIQQVRDRQNSIDQPHFDAAVTALGRPIHPEDFYTLRPEKLFKIANRKDENRGRIHSASTLSLGARLDPKGTDYYAQANRALELISIPLDVEFTRKLLRQALDKTYYSSRSISECRKMLAFYIYKQEQQLAKDFLTFIPLITNIQEHDEELPAKKEPTSTLHYRPLTAGEPMDFSPLVNNKIDTSPSAQIKNEAVIEAYETISKLLLGQNRPDQYCQVLTELGDLYFHCEKLMESKTAYCDVIDTILGCHDVVTTWFKNDTLKTLLSNRGQLLQKCGIWGCLLGAIVTSKLAKYHIHLNCDQHLQTCLLSSYFLRSIFFYTLPHSEHDIDYATLFIDNSTYIWPGIQLTSDEFRLNPRSLMDTLAYICEALSRHDICLHILPVIALYDIFAVHCRNIQHTVQARLIRLRVLIQLDLFHEAHRIIQMLLDGQKLPSTHVSGRYQTSNADSIPLKLKPQYFDNSKSIISDYNLGILDVLLLTRLSPAMSRLYGSHLSIEFNYLLSLFFVRLASRIPVIANLDLFQSSELKQNLTTTITDPRYKTMLGGSRITSASKLKLYTFHDETTRSFVHVKSYLVGTGKLFAERCLNVLQQTDEMARDYPSNLQSFEYQLLIDCLSLLSECAHQCHLDQLAARYAMEVLKILSMIGEDNIYEKKVASGSAKRKPSYPRLSAVSRYPRKKLNALNILFNTRYSHNLNVYAWLKQRANLCQIMLHQINALGKVKGTDDYIREEFANVNVYIKYGLNESEEYQCESMKATFLLYKALYNLSELVNINENIQELNTALQLFQSVLVVKQNNIISTDILYKKSLTQILLWEHQCVQDLDGTVLKLIAEKENDKLQAPIVDFFVQMRERIQMTNSNHPLDWFAIPILPLNNIYSSLLLPFVFAKLRIATIVADYAYRSLNENPTMNDLYENVQTLFRQCLTLNQTIVEHYVNVDYECLLHLARISRLQKRTALTTSTTTIPLKTIVQQLLDAIRLCYLSANDSQFIQTCYFELASVLLEYTNMSVGKSRQLSAKSFPIAESIEQPSTPTTTERPSILKQRATNVRSSIGMVGDNARRQQQQQQLKQAAAVAIRAATQIAVNQKHRVQLPGLAEEFSDTNELNWPIYIAGDILGYFVLPERRRIYRSEAEREILTLAPHFEAKILPESFDSKLDRLSIAAAQDITWLHLLNYQNAVGKRTDNRQLLSFDCDAVGRSNLFFLHVFPRFVGATQTLQSLSHYSSQCIAIYPSEIYIQNVAQITSSSTDKLPQRASTSSARTLRSAQTSTSGINLIQGEDLGHYPNINLTMIKRELPDYQPTVAFSLAWYSSNTIRINTKQIQNAESSTIYGFYTTAKDDFINVVSISLDRLLNLYKRYLPIAQVAETDPKQINQTQIQSILQELFNLLTENEESIKTSDNDQNESQKKHHLSDSNAYVELECFLNAKFGAQTSNVNLRDWFVNTLKQSSNTLLSTQD